jgi:peroxiredoxin
VAVAITNEKPEEARPFLKKNPFPFPVLYDKGGVAGSSYEVSGVPVTCLVDRDGKVISILHGFEENDFKKEVVSRVGPLLNP